MRQPGTGSTSKQDTVQFSRSKICAMEAARPAKPSLLGVQGSGVNLACSILNQSCSLKNKSSKFSFHCPALHLTSALLLNTSRSRFGGCSRYFQMFFWQAILLVGERGGGEGTEYWSPEAAWNKANCTRFLLLCRASAVEEALLLLNLFAVIKHFIGVVLFTLCQFVNTQLASSVSP